MQSQSVLLFIPPAWCSDYLGLNRSVQIIKDAEEALQERLAEKSGRTDLVVKRDILIPRFLNSHITYQQPCIKIIEEWNASLDPFRATYPGSPMLCPRANAALPAIHDFIDHSSTPKNIQKDLFDQGINLYSWTVMRMRRRGCAAGNFHVLSIETKDTDSKNWQSAVRFIYRKYNFIEVPDVQIEIFNGDLMHRYRSEVLPDNITLLADLE